MWSVRQENRIQPRHFFQRIRTERIRHHPWIEERHLPRRCRQRKRAVAKVLDPIALGLEHLLSPGSVFSDSKSLHLEIDEITPVYFDPEPTSDWIALS
jgi:hypothetical protein